MFGSYTEPDPNAQQGANSERQRFSPTNLSEHCVIIWVNQYLTGLSFGEEENKDALDVTVIDLGRGPADPDWGYLGLHMRWFAGSMIGKLKHKAGDGIPIIVYIGRGTPRDRKSQPPFTLTDVSQDPGIRAKAEAWMANHPGFDPNPPVQQQTSQPAAGGQQGQGWQPAGQPSFQGGQQAGPGYGSPQPSGSGGGWSPQGQQSSPAPAWPQQQQAANPPRQAPQWSGNDFYSPAPSQPSTSAQPPALPETFPAQTPQSNVSSYAQPNLPPPPPADPQAVMQRLQEQHSRNAILESLRQQGHGSQAPLPPQDDNPPF